MGGILATYTSVHNEHTHTYTLYTYKMYIMYSLRKTKLYFNRLKVLIWNTKDNFVKQIRDKLGIDRSCVIRKREKDTSVNRNLV